MDWLLDRQENDHCPYCRKEMISADELRQTAIKLLGPERVVEIGSMWQQQGQEQNTTTTVTPSSSTTSAATTTPSATATVTAGDIEMGQTSVVPLVPSAPITPPSTNTTDGSVDNRYSRQGSSAEMNL
jgi:hypothetical protein